MNKWVGMGRLTKAPEIRYTQNQKVVATFTLAVDRDFKNEKGERDADFINCVAWGKAAELIGNSCGKGHRLLVEGRLQIRQYDDKNGQRRWITEVIVSGFDFVERKADTQAAASGAKTMADMGKDVPFDETVPF